MNRRNKRHEQQESGCQTSSPRGEGLHLRFFLTARYNILLLVELECTGAHTGTDDAPGRCIGARVPFSFHWPRFRIESDPPLDQSKRREGREESVGRWNHPLLVLFAPQFFLLLLNPFNPSSSTSSGQLPPSSPSPITRDSVSCMRWHVHEEGKVSRERERERAHRRWRDGGGGGETGRMRATRGPPCT